MLIFVGIFLLLLLYGIRVEKNYIETPFDYKGTIALRGICALEIVIGHIGVASQSPWLFINRKAGVLVVGLFFFLSGYGLFKSLQIKENYMNKFLEIRMLKILFPALIVYGAYYIFDIISNHMRDFTVISLQYILLWKFPQRINWYVTELLFLYLTFYLLYKHLIIKTANRIMVIVCLAAVGIMWYLGMANYWFGSTLCFPLGILYAQHDKEYNIKIKEKYAVVLVSSIVLLCAGIFTFFFLDEYGFIAYVAGRNVAAISFCITAIVILMKAKIGNRVTEWLGTISYELFLVHEFFVYQKKVDVNLLYCICAFAFSIGSAILLHVINKKIQDKYISRISRN